MRKGFIIFALVVAFIFTLLYSVPKFINFNRYKEKFAGEIAKVFEIPVQIDGDISMAIIPRGYIIVKNIKVLNPEKNNTVVSIEDFYIEISLMDLFDIENIKLTKVILSGLNTNTTGNEQPNSGKQTLSKVLSGNLFNKIQTMQIQNSNVSYQNSMINQPENIRDINLSITKKSNTVNTYEIAGTLNIRNTPSNIKSTLIINNIDNYDASINFERKNSSSEIANLELKISKRNELLNITGDVDIKSDKLEKFIRESIPSFPDLKITSGSSKLSTKIKFTQNILQLTDIQLVNGNTFGTGNFDYDMNNESKSLNMKFSYFEAPESITSPNRRAEFLKKAITELKDINLSLLIDSFVAGKTKIRNVKLKTGNSESKTNTLEVKEFTVTSEEITGSTSGTLSLENNKLMADLKISAKTNLTYKFDGLNPITINSFDGFINGFTDNMKFTVNSMQTSAGTLFGLISKQSSDGKNIYNITINSKNINADKILSDDIFSAIKNKNKIDFLNNSEIKFKIDSDELIYEKHRLKSFTFYGDLLPDSVDISKLNWTSDNYTVSMKGKLNNILGNSGEMENISYEIKSFDFTNIKTGYLSQIPFLYDLLKGESGTITFILNGSAGNPKMTISGKTSNMELSADISSSKKKNTDMTVKISYQDAKLFINKIYNGEYDLASKTLKDNIGISFTTRIINDKSNLVFENINGQIAGQQIDGKITIDDKGIITANMNSANINLTQIIKNSGDEYKQNAMIYVLNNTGSNINLSIKNLTTYSRTYSNVEIGMNKFATTPSFSLRTNFDTNASISINGTISGNNTYSGTLKILSAKITEPFFGISNFDVISGYLNADLNFSTFGRDKSEFISNLNGNVSAEFWSGKLTGFSSKSDMEYKIYSSPTIITNNVIEVIEKSLSSGETDFSSTKINGYIQNGIIRDGKINIETEDLSLNGNLKSADLTTKSLSFSGSASISKILPDPMQAIYNAKGFSQNLQKEVVLENIISKVNPTYFQMKRSEYLKKNGISSIGNNITNRPVTLPSFGGRPIPTFPENRPVKPIAPAPVLPSIPMVPSTPSQEVDKPVTLPSFPDDPIPQPPSTEIENEDSFDDGFNVPPQEESNETEDDSNIENKPTIPSKPKPTVNKIQNLQTLNNMQKLKNDSKKTPSIQAKKPVINKQTAGNITRSVSAYSLENENTPVEEIQETADQSEYIEETSEDITTPEPEANEYIEDTPVE